MWFFCFLFVVGTFIVNELSELEDDDDDDVVLFVWFLSSGFICFQIPVLLTSSVILIDLSVFVIFPFISDGAFIAAE